MTDIDQDAVLDLDEPPGRSPLLKWGLIGLVVLLLLGSGGGAAWYFFLGARPSQAAKEVEVPLPVFVDLKPFVVSMANSNGTPHFVQLGVSLQLPRAGAGEMVTAVLPEIQDAMRQTLLGFKSEDLQTPAGVDRVRKAMTEHLNEVMVRVLGPERIAKLTAGAPRPGFVQNVLFATLIVE
ncbi:MAG TPA: flagellar basal body-associated FliL family protein [Stellaceae bacterium]|nr:flagellar basal body-associated FliL family protein [Stellaceae bacterium]